MIDLSSFYQICAWISSTVFAVCFIPQMYTTIRYKNVEGTNPWMWILLAIAYGTGLVFSLGTWQPPLILNFGFGEVISITMLICYKLFKK